jgi:putative ABC transport system ATP-binding protein
MQILIADEVRKVYAGGDSPVEAVRGVSLAVEAGEFVALMGPSGCGKSTLLHLCGAMDRPSGGRLLVEDAELGALGDEQLTRLRRERIGFVFQFFNLLPTLSVRENIALPLLLAHRDAREADRRAAELAERVGLAHRLRHFPPQLSGGEMQRAAIARAVIHQPALLIADEPTGNLDSENGARVLALLGELNRDLGVTILLATHGAETAAAADRVLHMRDGRVERIELARETRRRAAV